MAESKKEQLKRLLKRKKNNEFYARRMGITTQEVADLRQEIRQDKEELSIDGNSRRDNLEKGEIEIQTYYDHPPTPEEVIKDHKIDESNWNLTSFYSKAKSKGWLVTALFKRLSLVDLKLSKFQDFLSTWKPPYKTIDKKNLLINKTFTNKTCLVLSLCDFHIGKLDVNMVPLETRLEQYKETVNSIVHKAHLSNNIDEICFLLGNDLLQTDSIRNQTVKGTDVDASMTWDKSYEVAYELMHDTIHQLKHYCNKLTVVYVPGNHSASNEYFITHSLQVAFKADPNIIFQRGPEKYKCFTYGNTALFLNHGDNINDKLPLLFAQTYPKDWGNTKYHEILLGHYHGNNEKRFSQTQAETQGVRMRILPSLTGTDQWHYDNLFTNNIQAGIGIIYDETKGRIMEIEHRI